jgi:hypothetical protein
MMPCIIVILIWILAEIFLSKPRKEERYTSRKCTVPALFGLREWYEDRFSRICQVHDKEYLKVDRGYELNRLKVDTAFTIPMILRGYIMFGLATQLFVTLIGWVWWYDIPEKLGIVK